MPKRRFAIITWNNYPEDWLSTIQSEADIGKAFSWAVGQPERGSATGTRHIQAICYKLEGLSFKEISKALPGAVAKAYDDNWFKMYQYVTKAKSRDGEGFECGERPAGVTQRLSQQDEKEPDSDSDTVNLWPEGRSKGPKRQKSQSEAMMVDIISGELKEPKEVMLKYKHIWLRTYKGVDRAISMMEEPQPEPDPDVVEMPTIQVFWLFGKAGMGKTRRIKKRCFQEGATLFIKSSDTGNWWDGYKGETVVLLDDFRGNNMQFGSFLKLTDPYRPLKYKVQVKGGTIDLVAKTFFITTPFHPADTWKCVRRDPNNW